MKAFKKTTLSLIVSAVLVSCGGGGGDSPSGTNNVPSENPPVPSENPPVQTTTSSKIVVDSNIPNVTRDKITEIVTPLGGAAVTGEIVPTVDVRSTVMALDKDGHIIMLGVTKGNSQTIINAESTAIELIHLMLSPIKNLTEEQLDSYIRSTAGFSSLVSSVDEAFKTGKIVSEDINVIQRVLLVTAQLSDKIDATATAKLLGKMALNQALATKSLPTNPSVEDPFPFKLIKGGAVEKTITIDSSRRVVNNMPLAWSVTAKDYNGNILPNGQIKISAAGLGNQVASQLGGLPYFGSIVEYLGSNSSVVPDDNGLTFELILNQTKESKLTNLATIISELADLTIGSDTCTAAITAVLAETENLENIVNLSANDYISSLFTVNRDNFLSKLQSATSVGLACSYNKTANNKETLGRYLRYVAYKTSARMLFLHKVYEVVDTSYSSYSLIKKISLLKEYWSTKDSDGDEKYQYTVCIGRGGIFSDGVVSNCADELEIKVKKEIIPTAGAEFNLEDPNYFEIEAITFSGKGTPTQGKKTLIPNKIRYQSSDPSVATIDQTGQIKTLKVGRTDITLLDQATGVASNKYFLTVYKPVFNKSEVIIAVNEIVTLPLQNEQGQNITHNGLTDWNNSNSEVALLTYSLLGGSSPNRANAILVKGLKGGKTAVTGNNSMDRSFSAVEVTVDGAYEIKFTESETPLTNRVECSAIDVYGFANIEQCTSKIDARIRCVGAGCSTERFYFSLLSAVRTQKYSSNPFGSNECPDDSQDFMASDPNINRASTYEVGSIYWRKLSENQWVIPWRFSGKFTPLVNDTWFGRNVQWIQTPDNTYPWSCVPIAVALTAKVRVYDTLKEKYKDYTYTISVP